MKIALPIGAHRETVLMNDSSALTQHTLYSQPVISSSENHERESERAGERERETERGERGREGERERGRIYGRVRANDRAVTGERRVGERFRERKMILHTGAQSDTL